LGVERLRGFLRRHRRIALDTSVFIDHWEAGSKHLARTHTIFSWLEQPGSAAITSTITMTELLVLPYRQGDERLANDLYALLSIYPNLNWIAPNLDIADLAARIRARYRPPNPRCSRSRDRRTFAGHRFDHHDALFERVEGFQTLVMDQLL
jgi:predicted nucleic acid-binding protein